MPYTTLDQRRVVSELGLGLWKPLVWQVVCSPRDQLSEVSLLHILFEKERDPNQSSTLVFQESGGHTLDPS